MSKFIDLSHVIEDGMITYQGLPAPKIQDHLSREDSKRHYAGSTTFQIGKIEMVANTGTYIDAPFLVTRKVKICRSLIWLRWPTLMGW